MKVDEEGDNVVVVNAVVSFAMNICDEVDDYLESPWKSFLLNGILPDYTKIPRSIDAVELDVYYGWRHSCPLHFKACCGDVTAVREILRNRVDVNKVDLNSWSALHYAAWQGHDDIVKLLLSQKDIQPNLPTDLGYTALHFACGGGHPDVVKTLLEVPYIDHEVRDKSLRSPLDLCDFKEGMSASFVDLESLKTCSQYLKEFSHREFIKMEVRMPDSTSRVVSLLSGSNTTANQILSQLDLSSATSLLFALSVVSESLTLQLRPEMKPYQVIKNWNKVSQDSVSVVPVLRLTRDIRVSPEMDSLQTDWQCSLYLFCEAKTHYLYRCCVVPEAVAVQLSSILAFIGDLKPSQIHCGDKVLETVVPLRKTTCKKFVKKLKANLKQNLDRYPSNEKSEKELLLLRDEFCALTRQSATYGSCFFQGQTQKGFSVLVALNAIGLSVILKPNSAHSELMFSSSYEQFEINYSEKNDRKTSKGSVQLHKSSNSLAISSEPAKKVSRSGSSVSMMSAMTSEQLSFAILPLNQTSKNAYSSFIIHSKQTRLIVSLANNLANRRAANVYSANQRPFSGSFSPVSLRSFKLDPMVANGESLNLF